MFNWWKKDLKCTGSVLFRGSMPPRLEEFEGLKQRDIEIEPLPAIAGAHWHADLQHHQWGQAQLVCLRDCPPPPPELIRYAMGLTNEETESALQGESVVSVIVNTGEQNLLRDRKRALQFLRAVMEDGGLAVLDHTSQKIWSRAALDDELCHDADLDIEAIFTLHAVDDQEAERVRWLHTHGLAELGAFDFDILDPSEHLLMHGGMELLRAFAFAILEGRAKASAASFEIAQPGGVVRFVEVTDFNKHANPELVEELRDVDDADHNQQRSILCEPEGRNLLSFFRKKIRPSTYLSGDIDDGTIIHFSNEATALMANRARNTYERFRSLAEELARFEFPVLAKLGYQVDDGGENNKEHLWFEVHELGARSIDGTLSNQPYNIERLNHGDRGEHPADLLTDWTIFTPFGPITPRFSMPVRVLREHGDEICEKLQEAKKAEEEA